MRGCLLLFFSLITIAVNAQSFILNQFFQPSLSINTEYTADYWSPRDRWNLLRANTNVIVPVKSQLKVQMDFSQLMNMKSLADLAGIADLKAYQVYWTFRPQITYLHYQPLLSNENPFFSNTSLSVGAQTGVTGLKLLSGMRILFYTVNIGVQEELNTFRRLQPFSNAVVGVVDFSKERYFWYYGLSLSYGEGQIWKVLPIPFLGIDWHIAENLWWNITLPMQTRLEWKFSPYAKADLVASLGTYGWGFRPQTTSTSNTFQRWYSSGWQFRTGAAINLKNKRGSKLYLEAGVVPFRQFGFRGEGTALFATPNLSAAPYVALSLFYGFKRSMLGTSIENFLNF